MDVFPVDWLAADLPRADAAGGDGGDAQYTVSLFGKRPDGKSACVRVVFYPYFFVELPPGWMPGRQRLWIAEACRKHGAMSQYSRVVMRVPMWGFTGAKQRAFAQLAFPTLAAFKKARWRVSHDEKMQTYEASVDPVVRLFHLRDIKPVQWVRVARSSVPREPFSACDVEVECHFTDLGPSSVTDRPPLIIASWDIETYSSTGRFPLADNPDDCIIQIATAFQRYGEAEPYLKTVVALDTVNDVPGLEITAVAREADVITTWTELLRRESTDVMIGYNQMQ